MKSTSKHERKKLNTGPKPGPGPAGGGNPPTEWHPGDDLDPANGVPWATDSQYPGFFFYFSDDEEEIIKTLTEKLGRNNPYSPAGNDDDSGQADYFNFQPRDILGLALVPENTTEESQITVDFLDEERIALIHAEGEERLKKGLPLHKNPPVHKFSKVSQATVPQSGNNREEHFSRKYPGQLMLVILVSDAKNIHADADLELTEDLARTNANPEASNRSLKMVDHAERVQDAFGTESKMRIVDRNTGEAYNPDKMTLSELDPEHPVWIQCFDYLCGNHVKHPGVRTKIFNLATGRVSGRNIAVTDKTKYHDLDELGWETAIQRDPKTKAIEEGHKRKPWFEHFDEDRNSLVIAKNCSGTHWDSGIYPFIEKYVNDVSFRKLFDDKDIKFLDFHATCSKPNSEKKVKGSHEEITNSALAANKVLRALKKYFPKIPLIRLIAFPKQWKTVDRCVVNILELEKKMEKEERQKAARRDIN